jgi:hypothetical protein
MGLGAATLEIEEIKGISAHNAGAVVGGVPIYQIQFDGRAG